MTVDLSGDEIGLIQESLFMKIANLKQFERHCENQQEIQEYEKLLNKTYKWQKILEQGIKMKNKLIHTNLLSKHKHNSLLALATATHLEYCNYQYKRVMQENNYFYTLRNVLAELLYLVIFPIYALTHGFILYPVYIFNHIRRKKELIKRHDNDINCINELTKQAQFRADEHLKSATYNDDCFTIDRTGNKK